MALVKIGWGQRQDEQLIHVTEADRGKKCDCVCPDCGTSLIARQGEKTAWHFAHAQPVECYGESVLHKVAKQIIAEAVDSQKPFKVPSTGDAFISYDVAHKIFSTEWKVAEKNVLIDSADEEYRFENGQISDVVITSSNLDKKLALEVFITHKKSEFDIDKFSEIKQDVIELDLSFVEPLSDRPTLEEQVLQKAERYWLFNNQKAHQQELHNQKLEKINQNYFSEMVNLAMAAIQSHDLSYLRFVWPTLSKRVSQKGIFGETLAGEAEQSPKVTKLNANNTLSLEEYGCLTDAIVENRTLVNVCFTLLDTGLPSIDKTKPLLIFEYNPSDYDFHLTWLNINKWEERLKELARDNLNKKLFDEQEKNKNQLAYARNFSKKSDIEKIQFLANELSLFSPNNAGQFLNHWNTTWHVWKALVWKYKVINKLGAKINVQNIADDRWLAQLLNWPDTEEAYEKRSKNIWYWFSKDLEPSGVMKHDGRMFFNVHSSLPDKFIPWARRAFN